MSPRRMRQNTVERLVVDCVAAAIAEYELNRANAGGNARGNAGGNARGDARGNAGGNTGGNVAPEVCGCTYKTFLGCNPLTFNGTEGAVGISDDIDGYTNRFHELAALCPSMVTPEFKKIERYVWGLLEKIQGNVTSSKATTAHEAIRMAYCLMDQVGADKSFMSTTFTTLIDISPSVLDTSYEVELANGKVVSTNTVLCCCTLNLLNHLFIIDLLPTELGSFDVIIGMDWLSNHRVEIICYEKIIHIPLPNGETLKVHAKRPEKDQKHLLCMKADEKKLEDIPIVRNFSEVFPDDLSGLPPAREVEFRIELIPRAMPVARSPYRWHLLKCKNWLISSKNSKTRVLFDLVIPHGEHLCYSSRRRMVLSECA
ncbi:putative reverse transcriptase domain-containing protein [Tanacetum coccineum]|uniref:Reverse transcriptase domain-containing protein n=1 Tax=Tanacetum coccineum TaxID=301880 RepID=A0ABQ5BPT6_9ASTR